MALFELDLVADWVPDYQPAVYRHAGYVFMQGRILWGGGPSDPPTEILATPLPAQYRPAVDTTFRVPTDSADSDFSMIFEMTARTDGQLEFTGIDPASPEVVPAGSTTPGGNVFLELVLELGVWATADAAERPSAWHALSPALLEPGWGSTLQYRRHSPTDDGRVEWRGVATYGDSSTMIRSPNSLPADIIPESYEGDLGFAGRRIPVFVGDRWWMWNFYSTGVVVLDLVGSHRNGTWFREIGHEPFIGELDTASVTDNVWSVQWSMEAADLGNSIRSGVSVWVTMDAAGPRSAAAGVAWGTPHNWIGVTVTRISIDPGEPNDAISWVRFDVVGGPIAEQGGSINVLAEIYTRQVEPDDTGHETISFGLDYINDPDDPLFMHTIVNIGPTDTIDLGILERDTIGGTVGYIRDVDVGDASFDQYNLLGEDSPDFRGYWPEAGMEFDLGAVGWWKPGRGEGELQLTPDTAGTRRRGRIVGSGHEAIVLP